jgi:hypothetical protein
MAGGVAYAAWSLSDLFGRIQRFENSLTRELTQAFKDGEDSVDVTDIAENAYAEGWSAGYADAVDEDYFEHFDTGEIMIIVELAPFGYTEAEEDMLHAIYDQRRKVLSDAAARIEKSTLDLWPEDEVTAVDVDFDEEYEP